MGDDDTLTIDELAAAAGMTPRNVRAYRTKGLLLPPIRRGRQSTYRAEHLRRLLDIKELRELGLPLKLIMEAAHRGDDLSAHGPLAQLAATVIANGDQTAQIDLRAGVIDLDGAAPADLADGSTEATLVQRLSDHGVPDATVLVLRMLSSRSGRALATQLFERLRTDLLLAHPHELPAPLLSDTVELVVTLTQQALTQTFGTSSTSSTSPR